MDTSQIILLEDELNDCIADQQEEAQIEPTHGSPKNSNTTTNNGNYMMKHTSLDSEQMRNQWFFFFFLNNEIKDLLTQENKILQTEGIIHHDQEHQNRVLLT